MFSIVYKLVFMDVLRTFIESINIDPNLRSVVETGYETIFESFSGTDSAMYSSGVGETPGSEYFDSAYDESKRMKTIGEIVHSDDKGGKHHHHHHIGGHKNQSSYTETNKLNDTDMDDSDQWNGSQQNFGGKPSPLVNTLKINNLKHVTTHAGENVKLFHGNSTYGKLVKAFSTPTPFSSKDLAKKPTGVHYLKIDS